MTATPLRLFHFSEDADIREFAPRRLPTWDEDVVWAVDEAHFHLYLFPRDCPRVTFYAGGATTGEDRLRFLSGSDATRVVAIESAWLERMRATRLYRYELPLEGFELIDADAGYWVCKETVQPVSVEPVGDLLSALATAGVEVRITPDLWPLYDAVIASTMHFSIIRWRNVTPKL